jgi:predicted nucleic-acid-binding protein|tara:strand:+ start:418 stop:966 length:549 start_codon:yes stop_codon:yes gene_type:complete
MSRKSEQRTKHKKQDFLSMLSKIKSLKKACNLCGITMSQVAKWSRTDKWFADELRNAQAEIVMELETIAFDQALSGDTRQLQFLLKSWAPERYAPKAGVNVNVNEKADIRIAGQDPAKIKSEIADRLLSAIGNMPGGQEVIGQVIDGSAKSAQDVAEVSPSRSDSELEKSKESPVRGDGSSK